MEKPVQKLSALVDYKDESIVSRVLLKKSAGSVTLFAFAHGEELSEHRAPFDVLLQVLEGKAEITIADSRYVAEGGDLVSFPANVPHSVKALSSFKMLLTMIQERT